MIRRAIREGRKEPFGPWTLYSLRDPGQQNRWAVTCRRGSGTAVERHRRERQAREVLREASPCWRGDEGFLVVVQWGGSPVSTGIREGLKELRQAVERLDDSRLP